MTPRVVSLVPSVTETLLAWGIEPVGVTRFCEQPTLTAVGGTKDPDVDAIVEMRPDLVVVNDEENRREDADELAAAGLRVHVTHVHAVTDVAGCLASLAEALVVPVDLTAFAPLAAPPPAVVATAFVPIWRRPWMTLSAATYGSSLLRWAGVANVFDDHPDRYPVVTLDDARARRPDRVLAPSEPYPFAERHRDELRRVAVDVRFVDGRDLFWWGVRTPEAAARLRRAMAGRGTPGAR